MNGHLLPAGLTADCKNNRGTRNGNNSDDSEMGDEFEMRSPSHSEPEEEGIGRTMMEEEEDENEEDQSGGRQGIIGGENVGNANATPAGKYIGMEN